MLLRVFGCFMYMLLYPGHSKESFWQVIDVDKATLAVQLCMSKFLCWRDFDRILEFFCR